jgi:hypothetical protein
VTGLVLFGLVYYKIVELYCLKTGWWAVVVGVVSVSEKRLVLPPSIDRRLPIMAISPQ